MLKSENMLRNECLLCKVFEATKFTAYKISSSLPDLFVPFQEINHRLQIQVLLNWRLEDFISIFIINNIRSLIDGNLLGIQKLRSLTQVELYGLFFPLIFNQSRLSSPPAFGFVIFILYSAWVKDEIFLYIFMTPSTSPDYNLWSWHTL